MAIRLTSSMMSRLQATNDPQSNLETAVGLLVHATPPAPKPEQPPPGPFTPYAACAAPDIRTPPQFVVPYSQRILLQPPFDMKVSGEIPVPSYISLGCATVKVQAFLAFDLRFL